MIRKILIITYLFIMALFVSKPSMAQALTADRTSVQMLIETETEVNVSLSLGESELMYWETPEVNGGVVASFVSLGREYEVDMSSLSSDQTRRKLRIRALIVGVAQVLVKVWVKKNGIATLLQVAIMVVVNALSSSQDIPVLEQDVPLIDYLAIKED